MDCCAGKRLLILGGQLKMCDVVEEARKMGIYTIVTDWYEDSPAKKIADKACMVSTSDVDAVLELIRREKVDGVFTGFIDSTLPYYHEICKRAKLPCYLNEATLACCVNKHRFKEVCLAVGMQTIPEVDIRDASHLEYPILIKPVDNSGSKGITVCCTEDMVPAAYERALRFSKSKAAVVERFMNCDYVAAYYAVHDGQPELMLLMDKDMNRIGRGTVPYPTAFVYPSRYEESYRKYAHPKVQKLVKHLGMESGTFLISFFVSGRNYYAVELTARLTATREYLFVEDMAGWNPLGAHIRYALTGDFPAPHVQTENVKEPRALYCMLFTFIDEGVIGRIEGMEKLKAMRGLLNVLQLRGVGSRIRADGSYGQLFSRIYLKAGSPEEMVALIRDVQDTLQVYSEDGRPMVIAGFDSPKFFC